MRDTEVMIVRAREIAQHYEEVSEFMAAAAERFTKVAAAQGIRIPGVPYWDWDIVTWEPSADSGDGEQIYGRDFDGDSGYFHMPHAWLRDPDACIAQQVEEQKLRDAEAARDKVERAAADREQEIIRLRARMAQLEQRS